jgi:tetratricopeptide (TPR) repeat protein
LGVEAVVTGRVTERGDNVVVRAELTDGATNSQIWGEQYTRKIGDLQLLQQDIAKTVSEKLRLQLSGVQREALEKEPTQNPEAYQLYLRAIYGNSKTNEQRRQSIELLEKAIALDPNFASAYNALGECYQLLAVNGGLDQADAMAKAKAAQIKALSIDNASAESHKVMGDIYAEDWNWKGSENEYRQCSTMGEGLCHFDLAEMLMTIGRFDEALAEVKKYQEIDPIEPGGKWLQGYVLNSARRFDESIPIFHDLIRADPTFSHPHWHIAYAYEAKGQFEDAIKGYQAYANIETPDRPSSDVARVLVKQGKRSEAIQILTQLKGRPTTSISPMDLATI